MFRVLSLGLQVSTFAHLNCPACTTWPPPRPKAPANHATKTNECLTIIWKPKIYQKYSNVSKEKKENTHTQNKAKITNDKNRDKVRRKTTTFELKRNKRKPSASSIPVDLTDHAHRMFRRHAPRERRRHIHIRRLFFSLVKSEEKGVKIIRWKDKFHEDFSFVILWQVAKRYHLPS